MSELVFENSQDFEQAVTMLFRREGWKVESAPRPNTRGYDLIMSNGRDRVAVQIKNHKASVKLPAVQKFLDFLTTENGAGFSRGFFVAANGYAKTVDAFVATQGVNNVEFYEFSGHDLIKSFSQTNKISTDQRTYIGVFTAKGGVGKTTVAACLAGAFALSDYDVILVDLDVGDDPDAVEDEVIA